MRLFSSPRPRPLILLCFLAMVGTACTSGSDVAIDDNDASPTDTAEIGDGEPVATAGTIDDDLRYRCGIIEFALSELDDAPVASADDVDETLAAALGSVESYRRLDRPAGPVFVDPEPLDTQPPTLLIAGPGRPPEPCVAVRVGVIELRPVAFELVDEVVVAEGCVPAEALVSDIRTVGEQEILSLYGPPLTDDEADCSIDPTRPIDIEVGAEVRSGLVYPFVVPTAVLHEQLGFSRLVGALDPSTNGGVSCEIISRAGEADVQWSPLEAGFTVAVFRDDQLLHTSEATGILDAPSITSAAAQRLATRGAPSVEPPIWGGGFSDLAAPTDGSYRVEISGGVGERLVVPCSSGGSVGDDVAAGAGGGTITQAQGRFAESAVLPYVYMTVAPICPGCSGEVDLQLSPEGQARVFVPPLAEQTDPSQAGLVDPFVIHRLLLDAEAAGKDVTYSFDPVTGVPVEWTIDGEGARILCLEVDTAPPDLRVTDGCSTDRDLIGR